MSVTALREQAQLQSFASRLRAIRKERRETQEKFSELLGISPPYLSGYENARRWPQPKTLRRMARTLGIDVKVLWPWVLPPEDWMY